MSFEIHRINKSFMKCLIISLSIISFSINIVAQNKVEKYYGIYNEIKEIYYVNFSQQKDGKYEYYFDNKLLISGYYILGNKAGHWNYYDYNGNVTIKAKYLDDKKIGNWSYYNNKIKLCQINYDNGLLAGNCESYYKSGHKFVSRNYIHGLLNGTQNQYYENGNIFSEVNFSIGLKNGLTTYFYENGNKIEEIPYKNGKIDGLYKLFHENGKIFCEVLFHEGNKNTLIAMRDENGNHIESGNLKDGNGNIKIYFLPEHNVALKIFEYKEYKNGLPDGKYIQYDYDGNIITAGKYKKGFKVGKWNYIKENKRNYNRRYKYSEQKFDLDNVLNLKLSSVDESIDIKAQFPGGEDRLYQFISDNIYYPENAVIKNINGKVIAVFLVNEIGEVINPKTINSIHPLIDNAAKEVIKKLPIWSPAYQKGFPVLSNQQLPFVFKK